MTKEEKDLLKKYETKDLQAAYEHGVIDGRQIQMQTSVDRAVNAMSRKWVELDEVEIVRCTCECVDDGTFNMDCALDFARAIEDRVRSKNT
jgi:hypothetical protein